MPRMSASDVIQVAEILTRLRGRYGVDTTPSRGPLTAAAFRRIADGINDGWTSEAIVTYLAESHGWGRKPEPAAPTESAPGPLRRYLLFAYAEASPCGGWTDFEGSFATIEEAMAAFETVVTLPDTGEIVDTTTGQVVEYLEYSGQ